VGTRNHNNNRSVREDVSGGLPPYAFALPRACFDWWWALWLLLLPPTTRTSSQRVRE